MVKGLLLEQVKRVKVLTTAKDARNWITVQIESQNWRDTLNLVIFAFAGGFGILVVIVLSWLWRHLEEELILATYTRLDYLYWGSLSILGGFIALTKHGDRVVSTCLARIRSPFRRLNYADFLQGVAVVKELELRREPGDILLVETGKTILVFGIPAPFLGSTWMKWWFALVGLFCVLILPPGLPVVLTVWLEDGLSWWDVTMLVMLFYLALYYVALLYHSFMFLISMHRRSYLRFLRPSPLAIFLWVIVAIGFLISLIGGY